MTQGRLLRAMNILLTVICISVSSTLSAYAKSYPLEYKGYKVMVEERCDGVPSIDPVEVGVTIIGLDPEHLTDELPPLPSTIDSKKVWGIGCGAPYRNYLGQIESYPVYTDRPLMVMTPDGPKSHHFKHVNIPRFMYETAKWTMDLSYETISVDDDALIYTVKDNLLYWKSYLQKCPTLPTLKELVIPEGTTDLLYGALYNTCVEKVWLPASLESVEDYNVGSRTGISIAGIAPDNPYLEIKDDFLLSKDGKYLFSYLGECRSKSGEEITIRIPDGVETIGTGAFAMPVTYQTPMKFIFPSSLKTINSAAFENCVLTSLEFNEGLETIGKTAFKGARFSQPTEQTKPLVFPKSITSLGGCYDDLAWEVETLETDSKEMKINASFKNIWSMHCGDGAFLYSCEAYPEIVVIESDSFRLWPNAFCNYNDRLPFPASHQTRHVVILPEHTWYIMELLPVKEGYKEPTYIYIDYTYCWQSADFHVSEAFYAEYNIEGKQERIPYHKKMIPYGKEILVFAEDVVVDRITERSIGWRECPRRKWRYEAIPVGGAELASVTFSTSDPEIVRFVDGPIFEVLPKVGKAVITVTATDTEGNEYSASSEVISWDTPEEFTMLSGVQYNDVEKIAADEPEPDGDAPVSYYTLDGRMVGGDRDALTPGLYIRRQGSEARKIVIR